MKVNSYNEIYGANSNQNGIEDGMATEVQIVNHQEFYNGSSNWNELYAGK